MGDFARMHRRVVEESLIISIRDFTTESTPLPWWAVPGESTEFLKNLCAFRVLCGESSIQWESL
jgi:hypothetical protein